MTLKSRQHSSVDVRLVERTGRDVVGESPIWDDRNGTLSWVDIIGKRINRYDPEDGSHASWATADFPTAIGLTNDPNRAIAALAGGVFWFDFTSGNIAELAQLEDEPDGNRLNEAAVDPLGQFWVGTMQTNLNTDGSMREMTRNSGALYRVDSAGAARRMSDHEIGISNTMAWDTERGRFYFADTLAQTIYAYDFDPMSGDIANRRTFAHTSDHGYPDGSCLDAEGYLWNCRYAGNCVLRYAPDGSIDRVLDLPATNITACTFGGSDLSTLYVTSAANELGKEALQNPFEGSLMAIDVGVTGLRSYVFGGEPRKRETR